MEPGVHQEPVYINRLLEGFIRMIGKINIWMEIGILNNAFSIIRNYPLVDACKILGTQVTRGGVFWVKTNLYFLWELWGLYILLEVT